MPSCIGSPTAPPSAPSLPVDSARRSPPAPVWRRWLPCSASRRWADAVGKTVAKSVAKTPRPVAAADPGRSMLWLQGLLCGVLAALATPTALVLGVLLGPGLLALLLDRAPGRPSARAMLVFGLSATVFPLMALWKAGHTMEAASLLASDPGTVM